VQGGAQRQRAGTGSAWPRLQVGGAEAELSWRGRGRRWSTGAWARKRRRLWGGASSAGTRVRALERYGKTGTHESGNGVEEEKLCRRRRERHVGGACRSRAPREVTVWDNDMQACVCGCGTGGA
jgi:hypothetical protein